MKKIAVIGSGPAGLASTIFLQDFDGIVTLFEQNQNTGEKLRITGGGRMNVTNHDLGVQHYTSQSEGNLKKLFKSPWVQRRCELLEELGIEYTWEGNRAILKSQDAPAEVLRLTEKIQRQPNARIKSNTKVVQIKTTEDGIELTYAHHGTKQTERFDAVIIASGGMYRMGERPESQTIYALPVSLGHTITPLDPSLSPFRIAQNPFKDLSGISLTLKLTDTKNKASMTGNAILTHFGISGPVILDFSSVTDGQIVVLNFLPEVLEEKFIQDFQSLHQGKHLCRTFLRQYFPQRLSDWFLGQAKIPLVSNIADISKEQFGTLRKLIFGYTLPPITLMPYAGCWTTRGGVPLSEVNIATLESKLAPNVFFAGEILDANGLCGGYNISFAIISAKIVAEAIFKK